MRNHALPTKHDTAQNSLSHQEANVESTGLILDIAVNESKPSSYMENPSISREDSISSPQFLQDKAIDNSRPKPGTVANIAQSWQASSGNRSKKPKTALRSDSQNQSSSPKMNQRLKYMIFQKKNHPLMQSANHHRRLKKLLLWLLA